MQNTKPLKIYISAVERNIDGTPQFDIKAQRLLAHLHELGCEVYWNKVWRSYEIIEQEIAANDCLIAIVDNIWACSTWIASEVTWAMGGAGTGLTNNERIAAIPVFIYPIDDTWKNTFLKSLPKIIMLDRDIKRAISVIFEVMGIDKGVKQV